MGTGGAGGRPRGAPGREGTRSADEHAAGQGGRAERVEGLVLPAPLSGHPVLDFCNTFAGWDGQESGDYLRTYDHLAVWAAAAGLLDPC